MENNEVPNLYQNRELSWLKFNQRVLEQASDASIPIFERLRFLSIFVNNLDEFFMIRVGTLTDASLLNPDALDNKSKMSPAEQLEAIFKQVRELNTEKDETYRSLIQDMRQCGVEHLDLESLTPEQEAFFATYFSSEIQPMLSPQIIDKHHPFPFLRNKETYICSQLKTKGEFVKLAIIPVSTGFDRLIFLPFDKTKFLLIEELVHCYSGQVFQGYEVVANTIFRVTRNADINVDEAMYDHDIDYRSVMEEMVKSRRKLMPVRLEFQGGASEAVIDQLCKKLELSRERVFYNKAPLNMSFGFALASRFERTGQKDFFFPALTPQRSATLDIRQPIMPQIEDHDVLLAYPFESMNPFIALLREASVDESVISIKMTLYRVARESQVIAALIKAAESGKDVHVVVELRARFDEENNIIWSKRLEEAGVNVTYGLGEYKVHSKLLVITRKKEEGVCFITQVGTGNYNESTAKQYTDLSLMTADRTFGEDGLQIFNGILTDTPSADTRFLISAPRTMKPHFLELMDEQIALAQRGEPSRIIVKINSLTDKDLIDKLIEASMAGVKIRLIIRGICCLRVGVPGYTDNIEVVSIVGRFLEHSRVYVFGVGEKCQIYIGSADFMTRNTERRVEVAAPVLDERLRARLLSMLQLQFKDNVKARRLLEDGSYVPVKNELPPTDSQIDLFKLAYARSEGINDQDRKPSRNTKPPVSHVDISRTPPVQAKPPVRTKPKASRPPVKTTQTAHTPRKKQTQQTHGIAGFIKSIFKH